MNPNELRILEQIAVGVSQDDAEFAARLADGPRLSIRYRLGLASTVLAGLTLVMMFSVNLMFGVAGYGVLTVAGTSLLRHRRFRDVTESPLDTFHRITAGLFRNTNASVEPSLD